MRDLAGQAPGSRASRSPERSRQAIELRRHARRLVAVVAAEQLIAALAGERDGYPLTGHASNVERRHRRRVGERLPVMTHQLGQHLDEIIRLHERVVMDASELPRDRAGVGSLVVAAVVKADRKRLHLLGAGRDHLREDEAGIDAAAQKQPERHV